MQISEAWLREFVNPAIMTEALIAQLTMAGLEVDSVAPASAVFSGVVVAEVLSTEQHPNADKLKLCRVNIGTEILQIVCGASNVRVALKVPAALIGAVLPGDFKIKQSKLRGIESFGMLCSEKELGLAEEAHGLMELPPDAPVGQDIRDYLKLNDTIIEVDLTPNRADCLSVEGIAREVALLNRIDWKPMQVAPVETKHQEALTVNIAEKTACPRYLGRLIKNINPKAETPAWMQERLRRSGVRSIGPVVDVTNYVLLEMGQPLHAFDAAKLTGGIEVRYAKKSESLALLNGQTIELSPDTLVIADAHKALALAGIMGGHDSAVLDETQDIFLECAFFAPKAIAGKARHYGLHTDSSHRFERGVDPTIQRRAIEHATQLILELSGGSPGPIQEATGDEDWFSRQPVNLRKFRIEKMLGIAIPEMEVEDIFQRLGMTMQRNAEGWNVVPPSFRFDIAIEADLIEELARVYGYNNLPTRSLLLRAEPAPVTETALTLSRVKNLMVDRGYQEAITYSFVDEDYQIALAPGDKMIKIQNPISSDLSIMRSTLWTGLLKAAQYNLNRQQKRIRLFETGLRFSLDAQQIKQEQAFSGLILGELHPDQWGEKSRKVDFYDLKSDIEAIFGLAGQPVRFIQGTHPALHPGQTAGIVSAKGQKIGVMGMLHPVLEQQLGFETRVFVFELSLDIMLNKTIARFKPLSKFPSVTQDRAIIVKNETSGAEIIDCIKNCIHDNLQDVVIFDLYQGKGIEDGHKSVAVSITLQNFAQTLTDSEIDATFNKVMQTLAKTLGAKLRD